jgi:arginase
MNGSQLPIRDLPRGSVAILGIPFDDKSSGLKGAAQAPAHICRALYADSSNLCVEDGRDLSSTPLWHLVGDLSLETGDAAFPRIQRGVEAIIAREAKPLSLGGDHSVTYPIVRGVASRGVPFSILHIDAHPDLYDEFGGDRLSHACPFARILEEGLVRRLVQVGIRTMTPHQRDQAERFGVEVVQMRDWHPDRRFDFEEAVYVSLDLDGLDPAFAPGVSHHEPGGLSVRDVLGIIQRLEAEVVGADVVELNPTRDVLGMTAMVAAKFVRELVAKMLPR